VHRRPALRRCNRDRRVKATAAKAAARQPICLALALMSETLTLTRRPLQNR
jgi:hypothetical protein